MLPNVLYVSLNNNLITRFLKKKNVFSQNTFMSLLKDTCNFGPNYITDLVTCSERKSTLGGRGVQIIVKLRTDKDRERERKMTFQKIQDMQVSNLLLKINLLGNYFSCTFKAQIIKNKNAPCSATLPLTTSCVVLLTC